MDASLLFGQKVIGPEPDAFEALRKALEGRHFDSQEDMQVFLEQQTRQQNRRPLDEFYGLSPEQMYRLLSFPFLCPELVRFPEALNTEYGDTLLRAFPAVLDELPPSPVFAPEEEVRRCYTWRTRVNFAGFLGLAAVEPAPHELGCRDFRFKALPLLRDAVQFRIAG